MNLPNSADLEEAHRFLSLLDRDGPFTFQTFGDGRPDSRLTKVLQGSLEEHADDLRALNRNGAGIFVMVNAGDGVVHPGNKSCRTAANVRRVRAAFVDLDGAPLEPLIESGANPDIIVCSSPARWHAYWRLRDCPLSGFASLQRRLIKRFNSDPSVHDLPRVMRIPGFYHQKKEPYLVTIEYPPKSLQ